MYRQISSTINFQSSSTFFFPLTILTRVKIVTVQQIEIKNQIYYFGYFRCIEKILRQQTNQTYWDEHTRDSSAQHLDKELLDSCTFLRQQSTLNSQNEQPSHIRFSSNGNCACSVESKQDFMDAETSIRKFYSI